jgi:hypothetical protein
LQGKSVGSTASTSNLKSKATLTEETDTAEQRRARSLIALADIQKKIIQQTKKTATRVSLNKALDNLELQERGTKTRYSIVSLYSLCSLIYSGTHPLAPFLLITCRLRQ